MASVFHYDLPQSVKITKTLLRQTLADVRDQLLSHDINGGGKKLMMDTVCDVNRCGTAACIGGWASVFLLGFEPSKEMVNDADSSPIDLLFSHLIEHHDDYRHRLNALFHHYGNTINYDVPNIAATAIQRYLDGKEEPWPEGEMPDVLPYTRRAPAKRK